MKCIAIIYDFKAQWRIESASNVIKKLLKPFSQQKSKPNYHIDRISRFPSLWSWIQRFNYTACALDSSSKAKESIQQSTRNLWFRFLKLKSIYFTNF